MKLFAFVAVLLASTSANALQLSCELLPLQGDKSLDTVKIKIGDADRTVSVWRRFPRRISILDWQPGNAPGAENQKVLFHSTTRSRGGSQFSVLVIEQHEIDKEKNTDEITAPVVYFIDWGKGKFAEVDPYRYDEIRKL